MNLARFASVTAYDCLLASAGSSMESTEQVLLQTAVQLVLAATTGSFLGWALFSISCSGERPKGAVVVKEGVFEKSFHSTLSAKPRSQKPRNVRMFAVLQREVLGESPSHVNVPEVVSEDDSTLFEEELVKPRKAKKPSPNAQKPPKRTQSKHFRFNIYEVLTA